MESMRTHLYEFHRKNGQLVKFAGFEMPLCYEGIIPEHLSVRNAVGIFDVTHMGRSLVNGKDAAAFLNYVFTREVGSLNVHKGRYSVMCNEEGGILDDIVVFRLEMDNFLVIYNASNREKDLVWMNKFARDFEVEIEDVSNETVMFALQGPKAVSTLQSIVNIDLSTLRHFWGEEAVIDGQKVFLTRTGYTGEDGFEIFLWNTPYSEFKKAEKLWQAILTAGHGYGIKPCGLGARDTLRLEAGFCLYGSDIGEGTTPLEAKLDFAVQFEKGDFIGKESLQKKKSEALGQVRVGVRALDNKIPRPGYTMFSGERKIGYLTSGTFSPLLRVGIGMGYVNTEHKEIGNKVDLEAKRSAIHAEIATMPFYDETKYGRKRANI
jgi:aminomethyltransferase